MNSRVLLSFSSAYAALARRLADDLRAANIEVALDQWEGGGGAPAAQSVPRGVGNANFVLPLLTPSSATRSWIGTEWEVAIFDEAHDRNIDVLPVRGEICEDVPPFLENLSFADLRNRGYAFELRRLAETIRERSGDSTIRLPEVKDDAPAESSPHVLSQPLMLEVGVELARLRGHDSSNEDFVARVEPLLRDGLFNELGVVFPGLQMCAGASVPPWSARVIINGIAETQVDVRPHSILVNERVEAMQRRGFAAEPATNPANGLPCSWISADATGLEGFSTWDARDFMVLSLSTILRSKAAHFIGIGETRTMLAKAALVYPRLVEETVPALVPVFVFADVLRRLVAEGIGIRNLRRILMAVAERGRSERDPLFLTEYARAGLRREITRRASHGSNTIVVLLLHPDIESSIARAMKDTPTGSYLDLAPERVRAILEAVSRPVARIPSDARWPLLLAPMEIRSSVRRLLALSLPKLEVISYDELNADANLQVWGRIEMERFNGPETYVRQRP